jgi:AbrB family transcriptional regulator, transcriptional pleiotropic regulator of transition state genes
MESVGLIRKIDRAGRITLPKGIRRRWDIKENDGLEIAIDGDNIVLSKYRSICTFCGAHEGVTEYKDKFLCEECRCSLKRSTISEPREDRSEGN